MFGVHDLDLDGDEMFIETEEPEVNTATTTSTIPVSTAKDLSDVDMTLAQALAELKTAKPKAVTTAATTTTTIFTRPKAKGLVIQEHEQASTPKASTPITSSKDKGKEIMVEEPLKMKKKDQVLFDKQEAIRLQAQFDEEDRIAREKEEVNAALIAKWNDNQNKVETDYELAQRLQAEEQEELTIEEKSKLFQQLLDKRRKFFAAKKAEEKRNRSPTKAHQRSIMCTYLKNMAGWKPKGLKTKSFASVYELFDKAMKRVNTFIDMDTELLEEQEKAKKKKLDDDQEEAEMKKLIEVVPDEEEVAVDAIPLATKSSSIVYWKIVKEGNMSFYQIIRANESAKRYSSFTQMLRDFDKEDLETLWKLMKAKHGSTRPEEGYKWVLWDDLKIMFEPDVEDMVRRNLQGNKVRIWKLYDSCGVYFVKFERLHIFMLVEKKYPLSLATIKDMLNRKLRADYWNEMCYQLLKLCVKQLKKD
ncbi:hypothetical protein Tco_0256993 [Tanacetum coccineum]